MTTNRAGLRGSIAIFVVVALVDSVGTGTYLGGAPLYFTRSVGLTAEEVALGLTVSGLLGLIATIPWGHAAHRYGGRRVYLGLMLARGACFAGYALVHSFPAYLLVACLLGLVDKPTAPVQQELVALAVDGEDRQRALGWIRSTRNIGFVLGSGAAGLVTLVPVLGGYRSVVLVNAASFVVAAALATLLRLPSRTDSASQASNPARLAGLFGDRRYLAMTLVNGILSTHMTLLSSGLPLWILTRTSLPAVTVPIVTGVNGVVAVLLQVPIARRVRTTMAAAGSLLATGGLLAACCFTAALLPLIAGPAGFALAVVSVLFLTAAELAQSAGGWKLSYDLAPEAEEHTS